MHDPDSFMTSTIIPMVAQGQSQVLLYVVHVMQVQGAPSHYEFIIEHEDLISQAQLYII